MMISVNKGQSLNFGGVGTPYWNAIYCYTSERVAGNIQNLGMILDMNQLLRHMTIENRAFCPLGDEWDQNQKIALDVKMK